jgi:SagB-type dehydrogenase family enzyme
MKRRELIAILASSAAAAEGCHGQETPARYAGPVALPPARGTGAVSLEEALARRRSRRTFGPGPLPVATIGQLLWAGQGITSPNGFRTAPSAGALYALELYAVTASEVMHYLPGGHRAETRPSPDLRPQLQAAAVDQTSVGTAPVVIAIAAEPARLSQRYGERAEAYSGLEAAHAAQNILLQAAGLGLGAVPVAAVDGPRAAGILGLPHGHTIIYVIPVGPAA